MRALVSVWCLGVGLALGACGHSAPSARVADARLTQASAGHAVVAFVIEMENPNAYALPLHEARYTLRLGEGPSQTVVRVPKTTLRPSGAGRFELPVAIEGGAGALAALIQGGIQGGIEGGIGGDQGRADDDGAGTVSVPYRLTGTVVYRRPGEIAERLFDAGLSRPRARFRDHGTIRVEAPGPR
ncbi:MAG: hypothetical protein EA378_07035 [Phycisphaerales bacterium]|nr:MAG: hypothetical protein EA378_07035 [Phycisphaerales bacterium]